MGCELSINSRNDVKETKAIIHYNCSLDIEGVKIEATSGTIGNQNWDGKASGTVTVTGLTPGTSHKIDGEIKFRYSYKVNVENTDGTISTETKYGEKKYDDVIKQLENKFEYKSDTGNKKIDKLNEQLYNTSENLNKSVNNFNASTEAVVKDPLHYGPKALIGINEGIDRSLNNLESAGNDLIDFLTFGNYKKGIGYKNRQMQKQIMDGKTPKITFKKNNSESVILSVYKLNTTNETVSDTLWVFAKNQNS